MSQRRIKKPRLGATGELPWGKIQPGDEGELRFAVSHDPVNGTVKLEFGTPVAWLAMPPETAKPTGRLSL